MCIYPAQYDQREYIKWHEEKFPDDSSLLEKLEMRRNELQTQSQEKLKLIGQVLEYGFSYCTSEYKTSKEVAVTYDSPLLKCVQKQSLMGSEYKNLFKTVPSIVNKLWRKNKECETVNLSNIHQNIYDLIRTEIVSPTLDAASFLAKRLDSKNLNIQSMGLKTQYIKNIESITFEPEMKMDSGYFAYHGLVKFRDGITVELQIYSILLKTWRNLSHKLYDKVRIEGSGQYDFGSTESRLISLGHLLHLAECEILRLEEEMCSK